MGTSTEWIETAEADDARRDRFWQRIPLGALVTVVGIVLVGDPPLSGAEVARTAGLVVPLAGWLWWFTWAGAQARTAGARTSGTRAATPLTRMDTSRAAVYLAGLLLAMAALTLTVSPLYGLLGIVVYVHAWELPGLWPALPVLSAAGLFTGPSRLLQDPPDVTGFAGQVLANAALAGIIGLLTTRTERRHQERRVLVAELDDANRRLTALAKDNAELQAQLLARARDAGAHRERQRLAREMHDTVAQDVTAIIAQLEALREAGARPADTERRLGVIQRLARDALTETRHAVGALAPAALQSAQLPQALAEMTEGWTTRTGLPLELTVTGHAEPLHPDIEVALLRAAQEGLANVERHASASRVGLTVSYTDDVVILDLRDDGVGFDPDELPLRPGGGGGFGLSSMRHRVQRVAGELRVESAPGRGTAISATVPAVGASPPPEPVVAHQER